MVSTKSLMLLCLTIINRLDAFAVKSQARRVSIAPQSQPYAGACRRPSISANRIAIDSQLMAVTPDLSTVALVAGQETYGLAIVAFGEALWAFFQAPSLSNAKVFIPAGIAAVVLVAASGPMVTSGDAESVALGLEIATLVSIGLGASYIARLAAPFSDSPKEIAFLGLLVAVAGFSSFSQNLVLDGFVQLPNLPSIPFPQIQLGLGEDIDTSI